MKIPYGIDVAVALIFFNRPEPLSRVFNSIKKAKPSKLFLIQDGPRINIPSDVENIKKCKEIVSNIDWECDVYTNYSNENLGCGRRVYSGISWAFEKVDKLIILEDDCLPSDSFYFFCKEILDKYLDDPRIGMISGMNHLNDFNKTPYDYMFARVGSIAGWATWRRAWRTVDYELGIFDNKDTIRLLTNYLGQWSTLKHLIKAGVEKKQILSRGGKLDSWSYQWGINMYLQSALIVVPKYNLMSNIGLTEDSVHSTNDIRKIPKAVRKIYQLKLFEIDFPLNHPKYIIEDIEYNNLVNQIMRPNRVIKYYRKCESIIYRLFYGDAKKLFMSFKKKFFNRRDK